MSLSFRVLIRRFTFDLNLEAGVDRKLLTGERMTRTKLLFFALDFDEAQSAA